MLEYLVTKKEGIIHFIYKVTPLLSIDIDKEIVRKVIKQYILKVSYIYTRYILDLSLLQIQFLFYKTSNPKITRLQLLKENNNWENKKAFY